MGIKVTFFPLKLEYTCSYEFSEGEFIELP